ncbi:MAG: hypothetical protein JXA54_06595 [Candidatus Heimdallarchaeota archaeon]|nr:hypothetical protein [Candidatus Heimdallarchaeota archaeon]
MSINKKILLSLSLILLIFMPVFTSFTSAKPENITYNEGQEAIIIQTNYMTLKIVESKPHFIWWNGNQSTADEMYNVQFNKIQEFSGDDDILDDKMELTGISYNLLTSDWDTEIVEGDNYISVTLTLSGLANGAEIQFIINIFSEDQIIPGTDQIVEALTEVKFDIKINNWAFGATAAGLALQTFILESQQRNRVRIRNSTESENGNATRAMFFESNEHRNEKVAYYEWTNFADVFDGAAKVDTVDIGTAFFLDGSEGMGPGVPGMTIMYLTYPNYGDDLTLIHDPSLGIYPESFNIALFTLPLIGGLLLTAGIVMIVRKRK